MTTTKNNELLPVYLSVGADALKREAVYKRLQTRLSALGDLAFNSDDFNGETATGNAIVAACNTIPFASTMRLVHVRNGENLRRDDTEALLAYIKNPNPTTVLAIEAETLRKNTRLYKAIAAYGETAIIDCSPPTGYELTKKVRAMAKSHGVVLNSAACAKLIELVGENTVTLNTETQKIALAHQGNGPVDEQEVIALTKRTTEVKPWDFVNAFAARDLKKSIEYLTLMESSSPFALIAMCTTRIRELICTKTLQKRGQLAALASTLSQPTWRVRNHERWARMFSDQELRTALCSARDTEEAMKSGADPDTVFLDWVVAVLA